METTEEYRKWKENFEEWRVQFAYVTGILIGLLCSLYFLT